MEISSEKVTIALNGYSRELILSHATNSEAPLHTAIAKGMREAFLDLGVLDEQSNHEIVEMSYKSDEMKKKRKVK